MNMVCRLAVGVLMQNRSVFRQRLNCGKSEMDLPVVCYFDRLVSATIGAAKSPLYIIQFSSESVKLLSFDYNHSSINYVQGK